MTKEHQYQAQVTWTGNRGTGTSGYTAYDRDHLISVNGKPDIFGSSDPAFRGNRNKYNPEDSLVAALSACHMLWYLHVCSVNGVVVVEYVDKATGTMKENEDGSGQFSEVTLHPQITVASSDMTEKAKLLHEDAHRMCFIARSVNFPVRHQPTITAS
jgi:organic hydroperoxide reductase OsmC/OhrA